MALSGFPMELNFLDPTTGQLIMTFHSPQGRITIGRSLQCDVVIPARYSSVSSLHATISSAGDDLEIIDGDGHKPSTNGLFINGARQATDAWVTLSTGITVSLGKPNLATSITLSLVPGSGMPASSHSTSRSAGEEASSKQTQKAVALEKVATGSPNSVAGHTVSETMKRRLGKIDQYLSHGYILMKELRAFPIFVGSDGRKHNISFLNNPGGFSWIAFFFPFAVCTQIREWSYFFVSSIVMTIASVSAVITGYNLSAAVGTAICFMYGIYNPYLRHMARARNVREISRGLSILLGLLLAILAALPSFIIEFAAYYAKN